MRPRFTALLIALTLALPLLAATLAGVKMDDSIAVNGRSLVLNGVGLRKKLLIKVYVGALYLPAKQSNPAIVLATDEPRRMVMHFLYSVSQKQMAEAWDEGLKQNTPNASVEVQAAFKTLSAWMEPIPSGNRLVLTYIPGSGTTVEVNGKSKGILPGKATSDAILATWIGPDPAPGADFKSAVLGK